MKKKYIAPQTEMAEVELESGFMEASVYPDGNKSDKAVHASEQDAGIGYDFSTNSFEENLNNYGE